MNRDWLLRRLRTRTAAFSHDLIMIPLAWLGAFWLRFNLDGIPEPYFSSALSTLPAVLLTQGIAFSFFGLYRGVWQFASIPDLVRIAKAVGVGALCAAAVVFVLTRMQGIPRSVFPLYFILLLTALGAPRMLYRWLKEQHLYHRAMEGRALIVGAGRAGEMLARELLHDPVGAYRPVGFVDDDFAKKGREIHGIRVLGSSLKIDRLVERLHVDLLVVAIPSIASRDLRRILKACEGSHVPVRVLPRVHEITEPHALAQQLRSVSIEDLLGREPVQLEWTQIRRNLRGRCVMITGGGGSIGSELCRQIAELRPAKVVVFDHNEFNLYSISMALGKLIGAERVASVLGDVCDGAAVTHTFAEHAPDLVFHVAAYKHVPLLEVRVREAVRNNILGTCNVAKAASQADCEGFVLISTDKAVNPTNVMGATKRVAEMYCQNLGLRRDERTRFITVRFGNVLDSAGSVVPLFRAQIADGGPVTVTHPEVKRYFMTIPEACQLILEASTIGHGGEIYVLDMGEPVQIKYLAEQMIRLAGKSLDDIEIVYTGLRPGEKLFEELFHPDEALRETRYEKLLLARVRHTDTLELEAALKRLERACEEYNLQELLDLLIQLVPELAEGSVADRCPPVIEPPVIEPPVIEPEVVASKVVPIQHANR